MEPFKYPTNLNTSLGCFLTCSLSSLFLFSPHFSAEYLVSSNCILFCQKDTSKNTLQPWPKRVWNKKGVTQTHSYLPLLSKERLATVHFLMGLPWHKNNGKNLEQLKPVFLTHLNCFGFWGKPIPLVLPTRVAFCQSFPTSQQIAALPFLQGLPFVKASPHLCRLQPFVKAGVALLSKARAFQNLPFFFTWYQYLSWSGRRPCQGSERSFYTTHEAFWLFGWHRHGNHAGGPPTKSGSHRPPAFQFQVAHKEQLCHLCQFYLLWISHPENPHQDLWVLLLLLALAGHWWLCAGHWWLGAGHPHEGCCHQCQSSLLSKEAVPSEHHSHPSLVLYAYPLPSILSMEAWLDLGLPSFLSREGVLLLDWPSILSMEGWLDLGLPSFLSREGVLLLDWPSFLSREGLQLLDLPSFLDAEGFSDSLEDEEPPQSGDSSTAVTISFCTGFHTFSFFFSLSLGPNSLTTACLSSFSLSKKCTILSTVPLVLVSSSLTSCLGFFGASLVSSFFSSVSSSFSTSSAPFCFSWKNTATSSSNSILFFLFPMALSWAQSTWTSSCCMFLFSLSSPLSLNSSLLLALTVPEPAGFPFEFFPTFPMAPFVKEP